MQYGIVRLGGSKWHILKLQGDSLENVASGELASAIAFDEYDAAKTYVGVLQAEDLALAEKAAPPPAPPAEAPANPSVFVGLDLADAPEIVALQTQVKAAVGAAPIEWNTPDSFHVTVVYALDVPAETAAKLRDVVKATPVPDMQLKLAEPGVFNSGGGEGFAGPDGYALHYRIAPDAGLKAYQSALYEAFKAEGVTLSEYSDPAAYKPHVTMGYSRQEPPAVPAVDIPVTPYGVLYGHGETSERVMALAADPAGEPDAPPAAEKSAPAPAGNPAPIPLAGLDMAQPGADITAVTVLDTATGEKVAEAAGRGPGILDRLKGTLRALGIMPRTEAERTALAVKGLFAEAAEGHIGGIKALGDGLWIGAFTNNFEDRDGEIITTAALDGMIQRLNAGLIPMPELWYKHKSYTKHGKAIFIARAGHIVYAVGRFDKSLLGAMMEKHYKANPGFAMSHGFTFPPWGYNEATKEYTVINTFEISALPPEMAANLFTPFKTIGEDSEMGKLTEDQVKELERELGPQIAAVVVANHKQLEGAGEKIEKILGPAFKDFTSVPTPAAPAPVQTASTEPAPAPVETPAADSEAEDKAPDMAAVGQLLSDLMDSVVASNEAIMFLAEQNNAQQAFNTAVAEALGVAAVPASEATETALPAEAVAEAGKAKEALAKKSPGKENPYAEIPQLEGLYTE